MTKVDLFFLLQETRVRAGELDQALGRPFTLSISNQYGDDEVTHTLQTESREALQSWMEALWQLFFDMSKREGGWVEPLGRTGVLSFFLKVSVSRLCGRECSRRKGSLAFSSNQRSSSRPVEAVL